MYPGMVAAHASSPQAIAIGATDGAIAQQQQVQYVSQRHTQQANSIRDSATTLAVVVASCSCKGWARRRMRWCGSRQQVHAPVPRRAAALAAEARLREGGSSGGRGPKYGRDVRMAAGSSLPLPVPAVAGSDVAHGAAEDAAAPNGQPPAKKQRRNRELQGLLLDQVLFEASIYIVWQQKRSQQLAA